MTSEKAAELTDEKNTDFWQKTTSSIKKNKIKSIFLFVLVVSGLFVFAAFLFTGGSLPAALGFLSVFQSLMLPFITPHLLLATGYFLLLASCYLIGLYVLVASFNFVFKEWATSEKEPVLLTGVVVTASPAVASTVVVPVHDEKSPGVGDSSSSLDPTRLPSVVAVAGNQESRLKKLFLEQVLTQLKRKLLDKGSDSKNSGVISVNAGPSDLAVLPEDLPRLLVTTSPVLSSAFQPAVSDAKDSQAVQVKGGFNYLKDAKRHGAVPAERAIQWVMWGEALIELLQGSEVKDLSTSFDEEQRRPILPMWLRGDSAVLCAVRAESVTLAALALDQKEPESYQGLEAQLEQKKANYLESKADQGDTWTYASYVASLLSSATSNALSYFSYDDAYPGYTAAIYQWFIESDFSIPLTQSVTSPPEVVRDRQFYLTVCLCVDWALYHRAYQEGNDFQRGSYTVVNNDNKLAVFNRDYVCFATGRPDAENVYPAGASHFAIKNQNSYFAYTRHPGSKLSSHYNGVQQFGRDIRFHDAQQWSCPWLPNQSRHSLFGDLGNNRFFLKFEGDALGTVREFLWHGLSFLESLKSSPSGQGRLPTRRENTADISQGFKAIYTTCVARSEQKSNLVSGTKSSLQAMWRVVLTQGTTEEIQEFKDKASFCKIPHGALDHMTGNEVVIDLTKSMQAAIEERSTQIKAYNEGVAGREGEFDPNDVPGSPLPL